MVPVDVNKIKNMNIIVENQTDSELSPLFEEFLKRKNRRKDTEYSWLKKLFGKKTANEKVIEAIMASNNQNFEFKIEGITESGEQTLIDKYQDG